MSAFATSAAAVRHLTAEAQRPEDRPEVVALIPAAAAALAAMRLNLVAKRDRNGALIRSIQTGEPMRYQGESWEAAYAARRKRNTAIWADIAALKACAEVCDLTPDRAVELRAYVLGRLPRVLEYHAAVEIVSDIEADMLDTPEQESQTLKRLKDSAAGQTEELSDKLSYALTADQVALIKALTGKPAPFRRRWEIATRGASSRILSVPIKAPYIRHTFRDLVSRAKTQRDVRALFACWGLEATARQVKDADGITCTVLSADGWEVTAL